MVAILRIDKGMESAVRARLRRIEGQIGGLQRMLEHGRDCAEIAQQVAAVRAALDRVAVDFIAAGFEQCLRMDAGGTPEAVEALGKLRQTLLMLR